MTDTPAAPRAAARTYGQFCPVAVSLDVGDRWTILLMRDMLWAGAQRFHDLVERNPGLSTSVLTARLRTLSKHGLIDQLDEPKRRYVLTEQGEKITTVIDALYDFGVPFVLGADVTDEMLAYAVADTARSRRLELMDIESVVAVELVVGSGRAVVEIGPGSMTVVDDRSTAATIVTGPDGLAGLMGGMADVAQSEAAGLVTITGERDIATTVLGLFVAPATDVD